MTIGLRRLLPILLLALVACGRSPDVVAVAEIEGPMPPLAGRTLAGGALSPAEYAGRVIVVNFWAT